MHVCFHNNHVVIYFIGNESGLTESEIDFLTSYAWPYFYIVKKDSVKFTLDITIIGDDELEDNELFRIYVDEPKAPAGIVASSMDIIIWNDDSKLFKSINLHTT